MLEYHAAYYPAQKSGWFTVEVLDFPGALSQGKSLGSARRMIRDAVKLMAECLLERGQPLPPPDPRAHDPAALLVEPIRLSVRVHSAGTAP
jgi:predicted RNase H-like HicB family nuclease